jgi:hypothetical protein
MLNFVPSKKPKDEEPKKEKKRSVNKRFVEKKKKEKNISKYTFEMLNPVRPKEAKPKK